MSEYRTSLEKERNVWVQHRTNTRLYGQDTIIEILLFIGAMGIDFFLAKIYVSGADVSFSFTAAGAYCAIVMLFFFSLALPVFSLIIFFRNQKKNYRKWRVVDMVFLFLLLTLVGFLSTIFLD